MARFAFVFLTLPLLAQAPTAPPAGSAAAVGVPIRANETPKLDGRLDEPYWQRAEPLSGLRQREPLNGEPATEATRVRFAFNGSTLYVGVEMEEKHPDGIVARTLDRDRIMDQGFDGSLQFQNDDAIALLFDAQLDHRNAIVLATNPLGAEFDALVTDEGREVNISWRGLWQVAARRTPTGWVAEFEVLFRTLRLNGPHGDIGFNVFRMIRHSNEENIWRAWTRGEGGFLRVSQAGRLQAVEPAKAARVGLEVKPYALAGTDQLTRGKNAPSQRTPRDLGIDAKYELRPGLILDGSIHTDFAQVEADDQQVNLTRFSLFFPEKREFFLENAGLFQFGIPGQFGPPPMQLFFSRRIGIGDDGAIPVLGGTRLSGRVGAQTVGLIDVVTQESGDEPRTNFAVARYKRDVGQSGYIGVLGTDRRSSAEQNSTAGVDFSLWKGPAFNVQGFGARSFTPGVGGDGGAYRLGASYQKDGYGVDVQHFAIGEQMRARLGFVNRDNIRQYDLNLRRTWRNLGPLRRYQLFSFNSLITSMSGEPRDHSFGLATSPVWNNGADFTLYGSREFTRVFEEFDLADKVTVPIGDYVGHTIGWFAFTPPGRSLQLRGDGQLQQTFGGWVRNVGATLNGQFGSHFQGSLGITHFDTQLPGGDFTGELIRLRAGWAFTPHLGVKALVQYNDLSNRVSANVRFQWIHRPGSDLFLVFNEERGADDGIWLPRSRATRAKLTYLWAF